jgi:hypothetical protein
MPGSCKLFLFSGLAIILTQLVAITMRARCPAHRILEFIILMRYGELSLYSQMNQICNVPCIRDCTMYIYLDAIAHAVYSVFCGLAFHMRQRIT